MSEQEMIARTDLVELAKRCEALDGPCRETDAKIAVALGADEAIVTGGKCWAYYAGKGRELPAYTASLDSAMTLVPEGWAWLAQSNGTAHVEEGDGISLYWYEGDCGNRKYSTSYAATPALALTAACLRALAQGEE